MQDLAGPPYPQTHASFVGEGRIYKRSVNSAQSKHVEGVNEPQNWRLPQTIYFWISAVRATFLALMLFLIGSNYAPLLCIAPTYSESVSSTWSKQFKVGSFSFPRRFILFVGDRFNVKMGPYQLCVGWCTQLAIAFRSYRSCQQPKSDSSTTRAWNKNVGVKTVRRRRLPAEGNYDFQRLFKPSIFALIVLKIQTCIRNGLMNVLQCVQRREGA